MKSSQEIFDDIKAAAIELLEGMDDRFGFFALGINKVRQLNNVEDCYFLINIFSWKEKGILFAKTKRKDTKAFMRSLNISMYL